MLIVEDDLGEAARARGLLEQLGCNVIGSVLCGNTALRDVEELQIDLALLDANWATQSGEAHLASTLASGADFGVIFSARHFDAKALERCARFGPLGFVRKPCSRLDLQTAIIVGTRQVEMARTRARTARAQCDANARNDDILVNSMDAIVGTEEPGGIVVYNHSAQAMFGWTEDEVRGLPFETLLRAHFGPTDRSGARLGIETDVGSRFRFTGLRRDGTTFPGCGRIARRTGQRRGWTAILRDMSAEDALETELLQAQKMASVGLLAASVAHDFNNAITALRAQLYVAERHRGQALPLDECQATLDRCSSLTTWLLSLSSPPSVRPTTAEARPADLKQCVSNALAMVQRLLPSNIRIETELGAEPSLVRMEPNLIVHAVVNLILNARDALSDGGTIVVRIRADASGHYHLTVEDAGHGVGPEALRRAFEPFFTTKAPGQGTGLGLTSVRRMVETAGGTAAIASETGMGTCVTLTLPQASRIIARETRLARDGCSELRTAERWEDGLDDG